MTQQQNPTDLTLDQLDLIRSSCKQFQLIDQELQRNGLALCCRRILDPAVPALQYLVPAQSANICIAPIAEIKQQADRFHTALVEQFTPVSTIPEPQYELGTRPGGIWGHSKVSDPNTIPFPVVDLEVERYQESQEKLKTLGDLPLMPKGTGIEFGDLEPKPEAATIADAVKEAAALRESINRASTKAISRENESIEDRLLIQKIGEIAHKSSNQLPESVAAPLLHDLDQDNIKLMDEIVRDAKQPSAPPVMTVAEYHEALAQAIKQDRQDRQDAQELTPSDEDFAFLNKMEAFVQGAKGDDPRPYLDLLPELRKAVTRGIELLRQHPEETSQSDTQQSPEMLLQPDTIRIARNVPGLKEPLEFLYTPSLEYLPNTDEIIREECDILDRLNALGINLHVDKKTFMIEVFAYKTHLARVYRTSDGKFRLHPDDLRTEDSPEAFGTLLNPVRKMTNRYSFDIDDPGNRFLHALRDIERQIPELMDPINPATKTDSLLDRGAGLIHNPAMPRIPRFNIMVHGRRWTVRLETPPQESGVPRRLGLCCYDSRTIWVEPGPQQDTILRHELLHAFCPWMSEDAVLDLETLLYEGDMLMRKIGCP